MPTPILPDNFFSIAEIQHLSGRKQRARIIAWLSENRVPHIIGRHGWPLVYRDRLLPQTSSEAQNATPPSPFNFAAIHAPRRPSSVSLQ